MSTRHILTPLMNGMVLMVLALGTLPAPPAASAPPAEPPPPPRHAPVLRVPRAQAPTESAPATATQIEKEVEDEESYQAAVQAGPTGLTHGSAPTSTADPQSTDTCSAPAKIPFGQDRELLMGLMWNHTGYRIDQYPSWNSTDNTWNQPGAAGTATAQSSACTITPDQVAIFKNANYEGNCSILTVGAYANSSAFNLSNDSVSSIKVGDNVHVTIYQNNDYGGYSYSTSSDVSELRNVAMGGGDWHDKTSSIKVAAYPSAVGNVAATAWGTDRDLVLMKTITGTTGNGELAHMGWDAADGWGGLPDRRGLTAEGNPVVVARGFDLSYFVRSGVRIKWAMSNNGVWSPWADVPGIADAASDPTVISTDIYHLKLLYRKSDGTVKFTEWESGIGWRTTPVDLGKPSGTSISSDLGAVARDENHIAVFGVSANNKLWVKTWSNAANKSDWSDTVWQELASNIKVTKPAVASRAVDHMGVVVLNTSNVIQYKEWMYQTGWKTLANIGGYVDPPGLVATAGDQMFMYGVNSSGELYTKQWTQGAGWGSWIYQGNGWAASQSLAAIAARPHDLMLVGRNSVNEVVYKRFTNQSKAFTVTGATMQNYGVLRGQAIATVNGRTVWVSGWRGSEGKWIIAARDTATWSGMYIFLDDPVPSTDTGKVSLTTADLDQDGNDEVVLGTLNADGTHVALTVYKLTVTGSSVTAITRTAYKGFSYGAALSNLQVVAGDLDGDGVKREVAWGAVSGASNGREYLRAYQYTGSSLVYLASTTVWIGVSPIQDFEMAIGQVDGSAGEQVVLSTWGGSAPLYYANLATFKLDTATATFIPVYTSASLPLQGAVGAYSTAIATGDVDSDGLDEVIYTFGGFIYAVDLPTSIINGPLVTVGFADANRSLAVGDVDGDGRAEIVYSTDSGQGASGGWMGILKKVHPWSTGLTWYGSGSVRGVPLLADLDGDSAVATFKRCDEVSDVHVIAVANSFPVWYQNGQPLQSTGGGMANSATVINGEEDSWTATFGGSVSVGFEHEFQTPILAIKVGEVRGSFTLELAGSIGGGTSVEESSTATDGAEYPGDQWVSGAVCYAKTSYKCYNYELSRAGTSITTTAMSCVPQPSGTAPQDCTSLEAWDSPDFKHTAGSSWTPVGHRPPGSITATVNLGAPNNYLLNRDAPPVDPYLVWWDGRDVKKDVNGFQPSVAKTWSIDRSSSTTTMKTGSFDLNATVSAGFTALDFTMDASFSAGYGKQWSSSVGYGTGLEFSGEVYNYPSNCPVTLCKAYTVAPFVYQAQARTLAGVTYPYLEQDYYVTSGLGMAAGADQANAQEVPQSIVGLAPQAPVITSTTHPDPAAWHPTNTVTLEWGQPAGDPAVVIGYKWNLDQSPVATPTASSRLTTTHTYQNLPDGLYYLHIQAVGDAGDRGPVTHRAIRVDTNEPQVEFVLNPSTPQGSDHWYNTPITVSVAATDTTGSGVASVETSADGTIWLPYSAPIPITANTPGTPLWARATDGLGHVSDLISTTLKLDTTPPTTVDSDGYGLSYASILTDEVGNAQLVLGGALSDTLSGRLQVEVKAGDTGQWHAVSAVGDLPLPPGNQFSTTMTSLQWIYTPTFEIRGVYPLWGRGMDTAGNYEPTWIHGVFWWEPDDVPVLDETRVSVSPHQVHPGDEAAYTVAVRNSGYQEAKFLITDTVPVGLTVLPESISNEGQYSASGRIITWTLHALWPGQTQYLFFKATADSTTTPVTLTNQVDVMAYWPWEPLPGVPPEPDRHYYSTTNTLAVLPGASGLVGQTAPRILNAAVVEGEIVSDPQVTLLVNATPNASFLYVKEWTWDGALTRWSLARESGSVPFEAADGFVVSEDASGKYGRYQWTLSQGDGIKYLGVWVADVDGQVTNVNEGNLLHTNLMSAGGQSLAAGQRVQYRVGLRANALAVLSLVSLNGDADLYVWNPRAGFMPNYYSNAIPSGQGVSLDTVGFFAQEEGLFVIEVQAATDATYILLTAGALSNGALSSTSLLTQLTDRDREILKAQEELMRGAAQQLPQSTHLSLADKARPAHPLSLSTPYGLGGMEQVPNIPGTPGIYLLRLPVVYR